MFVSPKSVREGVPGEEGERPRCREALRHEGVEEGDYRPESEDGRTHADGAAGAGAHPPVSVPHNASLRLSDRHQAAPHSRLGHIESEL